MTAVAGGHPLSASRFNGAYAPRYGRSRARCAGLWLRHEAAPGARSTVFGRRRSGTDRRGRTRATCERSERGPVPSGRPAAFSRGTKCPGIFLPGVLEFRAAPGAAVARLALYVVA